MGPGWGGSASTASKPASCWGFSVCQQMTFSSLRSMQSLRRQSLGKLLTWVGLRGACWPGGHEREEGCGPWPHQLIVASFPEAEAMPASLSYEELVRRNVVSLSESWRVAG